MKLSSYLPAFMTGGTTSSQLKPLGAVASSGPGTQVHTMVPVDDPSDFPITRPTGTKSPSPNRTFSPRPPESAPQPQNFEQESRTWDGLIRSGKRVSAYFLSRPLLTNVMDIPAHTPDPFIAAAAGTALLFNTAIDKNRHELIDIAKDAFQSSKEFVMGHPIILFPVEILITIPFLSPFLGETISRFIQNNAPSGPLADLIIGNAEIHSASMPSVQVLGALTFIGIYASFHNTGLSGLGDFVREAIPGFRTPDNWNEYNENPKTQHWSPIRKFGDILLRGGTYSLSHVSNQSLDTPFDEYENRYATVKEEIIGTAKGAAMSAVATAGILAFHQVFPTHEESIIENVLLGGLAAFPLFHNSRLSVWYGKMLKGAIDYLGEHDNNFLRTYKFIPQTLPDTLGTSITFGLGILGSIAFYGLFDNLIGIHGDNMFEWLLINSIVLAPFVHKLTSEYYGEDIQGKAWSDVRIYFILNIVAGLCMGPNFTEEFKVAMDLTTRGSIILGMSYLVGHPDFNPITSARTAITRSINNFKSSE